MHVRTLRERKREIERESILYIFAALRITGSSFMKCILQSAWTGLASTSSTPASTPAAVMPSTRSATPSLPVSTTPAVPLTCNWTEHTSPEGFKYYYNSITRESKVRVLYSLVPFRFTKFALQVSKFHNDYT